MVDSHASTPVQPVVERVERDGDAVVVHWRTAPAQTDAPTVSGAPLRPFTVVGIIGHDGPVQFRAVE